MALLYLCAFLMDAATAALLVVRSPLALSLGASELALGLLGAAGTAPYMVSCLLFGRASDRYGRRRVLAAGVLALLPVWALMPACRRVWQFGLLIGLWSFFLGAFWSPLQAWIGDLRPAGQVAGGVRGFNLGWSIGVMVGSLIGGSGLFWPFAFSLGCGLAILLLVRRVPSPARPPASPSEPSERQRSPVPPLLLLGWVSNALAYFTLGSIYSLFPRLAQHLGLSGRLWASLAFLLGGGRVISFLIGGARPAWFYRPASLFLSQGVLLGALGLLIGGRSAATFALAFVMVGGAAGFSYFWSLLHSLEGTARKGRTTSYHEAILRTGDFSGSLLAGVVVAQADSLWAGSRPGLALRSPYLLTALLGIGALIWQGGYGYRLSKQGRRPGR